MEARNRAIVALMLDSGLRQNEVCALCRKDIRHTEHILKICGKGQKERVVPIGDLSLRFLNEYYKLCPYKSKLVFVNRHGEPMTCNGVKLMISKIAKTLSFEFSSHKLRHNFATNYCLDQYEKFGHIDIYKLMVLMGHEEIDTTRRYLHFANQIIASRSNISNIDMIFEKTNLFN